VSALLSEVESIWRFEYETHQKDNPAGLTVVFLSVPDHLHDAAGRLEFYLDSNRLNGETKDNAGAESSPSIGPGFLINKYSGNTPESTGATGHEITIIIYR